MPMSKYDVFELVTHLRKCPDIYLEPSSLIENEGLNSIALVCDTYRIVCNDFLKNEFKKPSDFNLAYMEDISFFLKMEYSKMSYL